MVRAAPVRLAGVQAPVTVSDPAGDAVLSDLAPGPRGDAVLVWTAPRRTSGAVDPLHEEVRAARWAPAASVPLGTPELLADSGPHARARVAVDPSTDDALVVWETLTKPATVDYALGVPTAP